MGAYHGVGGRGPLLLAVSWSEAAVGIGFFAMRFFTSLRFTGRWRIDFWMAALTTSIGILQQVFLQLAVDNGLGSHISSLTAHQLVQALKWGWVFQLLAIAQSVCGKLTVIAFLLEIRGRQDRKPWFLWFVALTTLLINIVVWATILNQCDPVPKLWDDSIPGNCDRRVLNQNYSFFQASWNSAMDVALALYPTFLIWGLQMKRSIKIGLSCLMGLGLLAAACSAVKTAEIQALTETTDITFAQTPLLLWASTEGWIVLIVSCVPPIRPLLEFILRKAGHITKSSLGSSQKPSNGYYGTGTRVGTLKNGSIVTHSTGTHNGGGPGINLSGAGTYRGAIPSSNHINKSSHGAAHPIAGSGRYVTDGTREWFELVENNSQEKIISSSPPHDGGGGGGGGGIHIKELSDSSSTEFGSDQQERDRQRAAAGGMTSNKATATATATAGHGGSSNSSSMVRNDFGGFGIGKTVDVSVTYEDAAREARVADRV